MILGYTSGLLVQSSLLPIADPGMASMVSGADTPVNFLEKHHDLETPAGTQFNQSGLWYRATP
jgi:hypothetical protein